MQEKYRKHMTWWFDEFDSGHQVDHYVALFPELDSRLVKFAIGIFIWNMQGLIDIDKPDDVSRVRLILKALDQTPGYDFFNNVFNEASPDTVCGIIGIAPKSPIEEDQIDFDYTIHLIENYNDVKNYLDMVSWRIVISKEAYDTYASKRHRFYFCGNGDWWDVPCVPGTSFPHDRFGYSLIAVEVTPDNQIASVTSRWNTYAGNSGAFLSNDELRHILGESNFNKLLIHSTKAF